MVRNILWSVNLLTICLHNSSRYFFLSDWESLNMSFVKNSYSIASIFDVSLLFFNFLLAALMIAGKVYIERIFDNCSLLQYHKESFLPVYVR